MGPAAPLWLAGLLGTLALFVLRRRLRRRLHSYQAGLSIRNRLRSLLISVFIAALAALPGPLIIAFAGTMIGQAAGETAFGKAIASGAVHVARFLYAAVLLRMMLADGASADRLLNWPRGVRESLDSGLRRLTLIFAPLYFVVSALAEEGMFFNGDQALQAHHNSLGRFCFLAAVLAMLQIGRQTLKPDGAVSSAIGERLFKKGIARARVSRFAWNLCWSLAFALALAGYYVTAYTLVQNLLRTALMTIVLVLAAAMIRQWRLDRGEQVSRAGSPEEAELDRVADGQVRRLSHFGLTLVWIASALLIWSAALPALTALKRVQLLPEFKIVLDRIPNIEQQSPIEEPPKLEASPVLAPAPAPVPLPAQPPAGAAQAVFPRTPLYLSDLLLALLTGILTAMVVSNIPGLLRFTVFRRVNLDVGGEYAVTTVARYLVIIAGVLIVSMTLGLEWSKVQWLAAALTFGIGFGLQEIFANFASGLILLFDRSIRVGDAVTVGTLSGVVSRIQMRATTITLWDRSAMVVPNKEFITTKLVNWTLSNPETRVDLKVGVDYASDVEQVRDVLMRLALDHPAVLKHPSPQVFLTEFADSAIVFVLQSFCLYSYGRPVLLDELHRAVVREFRRLGIVIAFPQLDVHLSSEAPPAHGGG